MILMPECSLLRTYYKEKGNLFQWHALAKQKELPCVVFSSCSPWREGWSGAGSQGAGTQLPAFFCGVAASRRPSPATPWRMLHKDRLSSRTCLEEAEIKAKRERIGKRRNRCEIGPVFQQWYWPCSHPVGFGELLCEKWSVPRGERKIFPPGLWWWKKKSTKSCELGGNGLEKTVGSKARTVL